MDSFSPKKKQLPFIKIMYTFSKILSILCSDMSSSLAHYHYHKNMVLMVSQKNSDSPNKLSLKKYNFKNKIITYLVHILPSVTVFHQYVLHYLLISVTKGKKEKKAYFFSSCSSRIATTQLYINRSI